MKELRPDFAPERVSVCMIVHVPTLEGHWRSGLDIVRACLSSVMSQTREPHNLLVFDNGSCAPVVDYLFSLRERRLIDVLLLSERNMGKCGALNVLLPACPGEVIAYSDCDVLFRPGWLSESLEVLDAFDGVGMVTGRPGREIASRLEELLGATLAYGHGTSDVEVRTGDLVDAAILAEHARSIGMSLEQYLEPRTGTDVLLTRSGVSAYAFASHFQFVARKDVLMGVLPLPAERALGGDLELDRRMNASGLLRLSLPRARVHHLGNELGEAERDELRAAAYEPMPNREQNEPSLRVPRLARRALGRFARSSRGRRMIRRAQAALFELLRT